ncbi:hypothetical protein I603_0023 [Erythrobacter dokdonensis DSW-74]|uniref:Uncharacterized protein n=2 Tax=Erythrobacter TaxID=1041 RepID=A0A1A7BK87_9SPHN|nr:hypothetical protein I603_0023 [Erythrobacter dokdonensis DSW-74]
MHARKLGAGGRDVDCKAPAFCTIRIALALRGAWAKGMHLPLAAAPILLVLNALPALAQPLSDSPADTEAQSLPALPELTAARLNRMCSPAGMMQYAFGETGVPGSTKVEQIISPGFAMPASFAPFERAKPMATAWSNRLFQMTYSFKLADEDEAQDIMSAIGDVLEEEAGWTYVERDFDTTPLSMINAVGWLSFEKAVEAEGAPTRVFLALDHGLGEVTLTCSREDLTRVQFGEAFGRLPEGTPRPAMPEVAIPPALDPVRCADEAVLAEMRDLIADARFADRFSARMLERTSYRDRLTTWMIWKLDQSGKIDTMEIVGLVIQASGYASPDGNPLAAMKKVLDMLPIVKRMGEAQNAGDPQGLCLALADFQIWIMEVDALTSKQTEAAHAALEAKARELGVSLD